MTAWIIYALAAVGAFALVSVAISLFSRLGRRVGQLYAHDTPGVDSADFLAALAGSVNGTVQQGGEARLLNNGVEFLDALLDDFARARHTINFMVYIWEPGAMSDLIADALAARARAGIEVRVLVDGLGSIRMPDDAAVLMRDAGAHVRRFRTPRFGRLTRMHKRNHRRAIVVDGGTAYIGGAAVGDKWLGDADTPDHWRDIMVRVTGSMAPDVQSAFAELWAHCCGEVLVGCTFYPHGDGDGDGDDTSVLDNSDDTSIRDNSDNGNGTSDDVDTAPRAATSPKHVSLISSPSSEEHPVRLFFNLTFLAARERLWITTPYFVPDRGTWLNIADRARAGVDVRILLPNERTDARPIRWAAHGFYAKLLEHGVRIWEYQPTMLHSKAIVVDGVWSIVGSANIDIRSKELNEENMLGIQDRAFAAQLEQAFLRDIERAKEILLAEWKQRGIVARGLERAAAVFSEQY